MKDRYGVADGRALAKDLERQIGGDHGRDVVTWLCDRVEELEAQLGAKMGQVEGVCSICGAEGFYTKRAKDDPSPSKGSVVGLLAGGLARALAGEVVLHNHDGVLICRRCRENAA